MTIEVNTDSNNNINIDVETTQANASVNLLPSGGGLRSIGTTPLFGPTGNGIASIELTSTSGLVDTYTITFTNGNTTTFDVTNGQDGTDGQDGNGIVSIEKTGTSGLVDTYTITYTDGNSDTFTVTNGQDGQDGQAATISVGTVSTGAAGTSATVVNSGTASAAVLDFTIPKGDKGDTGTTGADGYSPTATVTKSGTTATITITDINGTTTANIYDGTGGGGTWGSITGTLSDQTDLQTALDSKQDLLTSANEGTDISITNSADTETVSGNGSLTITNAKADGLDYLKLFGDCEQTETPTPTVPVDIVSNNGAIKYSLNMANVNAQTALVGYYISSSGVVTADVANWIYQDYIPVEPSTTYTLTISTSVYYVTISEYSTADDSGFVRRNAGSTGGNTKLTITTKSNTKYIRFGTNIGQQTITLQDVLAINWMLNKGNSLPYAPYSEDGIYIDGTVETVEVDTTGDTATAEMLLKVGDYQDIQSVLDGEVTRNVGVKVLDGTEDWGSKDTYGRTQLPISNIAQGGSPRTIPALCTHYQNLHNGEPIADVTSGQFYIATGGLYFHISQATSTDLKTWLANQYANGTPVIVVYPLATPTTETVTGQHLGIQAGTNTVEITQASINNLPLEVSCQNSQGGVIISFTNDTGYITGITSGDVTTALGYTPYNSSNPNGYTSNVGTVTSVNNVQPVNGNVTISIPDISNLADVDLSNLSSTGKKVIDGQWVASALSLASGVTYPTTTDIEYSLSTYLPNDGYNYEVLINGTVATGSSSGNAMALRLQTDIINDSYFIICNVTTRTNAVAYNSSAIVAPVGTGRKIIVKSSSYTGTYSIYLKGYRRIGTNS